MRVLNVSEFRKNISHILASGERIGVRHPKGEAILIPKQQWEKQQQDYDHLEKELLNREMDEALSKPQEWYTTEQVEAMILNLRNKRKLRDKNGQVG